MVDISILTKVINQLITGRAPPCSWCLSTSLATIHISAGIQRNEHAVEIAEA